MTLPHPSSISNWTSTVNAEPGFFKEVFEALQYFPTEDKDCNLVLDGMSIRKQILWDSKNEKFIGYCDFGNDLQLQNVDTPATEALVFMLVSINGKWKWPIGYFLQTKSSANIQAELMRTAINLSIKYGLRVLSVTCDGTFSNFSSLSYLGCTIRGNIDDLVPYFLHGDKNQKIYFIPDACHMLKLARNAIANCKQIKSKDGVIDWKYIEALHKIQDTIGLKFANKLSKAHIEWENNKMKVKLAAQTLSSSTADALEFLKNQKFPEFAHCDATVKFIRTIDRIFDFLNSRLPFAKGYKKPIYADKIYSLEKSILPLVQYLFTLIDQNDKPLYQGKKKTFIIGLTIAVFSVFSVAKELLPNNKFLKYILTYRFSQDHIELLFSRIRKRYGLNNNPNVLQFKTAIKQIILKNSITPSPCANSFALDDDPVGNIFDIKWAQKKVHLTESDINNQEFECVENNYDELGDEMLLNKISIMDSNSSNLYDQKLNILYYIAGFVVKTISPKVFCISCKKSLLKKQTDHNYGHKDNYTKFVDIKNFGGLVSASSSVFEIIKETEKKIFILTNNLGNMNVSKISTKIIILIKNYFSLNPQIFSELDCEEEYMLSSPHKLELIKLVVSMYLKIRFHAFAKNHSLAINCTSKRNKLNKLVLFLNQ